MGGLQKNASSIFVSLFRLFLLFALPLIQMSGAAKGDKKIWCCQGWSDDSSLSPPGVDTSQIEGLCRGALYCNGNSGSGSGSDCATNWDSDETRGPGNKTDANCFSPQQDKECLCDSDWCNCPQNLKGKKSPELNDRLNCCEGSSNDTSRIVVRQFISAKNSPCKGVARGGFTNWAHEKYSILARLREDCYEWKFKRYGGVGDDCRCGNNFCNCPPHIKEREEDKEKGKGGAKVLRFSLSIQITLLFLLLRPPLCLCL